MSAEERRERDLAKAREALERLRDGGGQGRALIHLRRPGEAVAPEPGEVRGLADALLKRVTARTGRTPGRTTVLSQLGTLSVQGDPELLLGFLGEPETGGISVEVPGSPGIEPIPPVRRRPAKPGDWA